MKKIAALTLLVVMAFGFKADSETLEIGSVAPMVDYKMQDIGGKEYSLSDLKKENGLLVIFSCNTCPFVLTWEDTYPELYEVANLNGLGMVLVNSNTKKRSDEDSMEAMRSHAKKAGYKMPYLVDEKNKLADAFGARSTPHVYLFNNEMELVYRGSINNKYENKTKVADKFYLKNAIKAMLTGEKIDPADTKEIGCSIKRV